MSGVAKRLFFDVPGFGRLHSTGGTIKFAGDQATFESSVLGGIGTSEEYAHGELTFAVKNVPGLDPIALKNLRNIDVTVSDDGDKTWLCGLCSTVGDVTLDAGEYSITMHFADQEQIS